MTSTSRVFKENDVVIYMVNYSKDELGLFTYEMDYNLDVTYIHLLTHNGESIDMNALRSSLWRVSNIWSSGYYKEGFNWCTNRYTRFIIPLLYDEFDNNKIKEIARQEIEGVITFLT